MTGQVSVVIPTFNCGRFIALAVESALGQTVRPAEVIVIDDGSTDDTEAVVGGFGDKIKYIKQANAGVSAARNRGVAESSSEFIAFLDADDIWGPTKLEKQLKVIKSDAEIGLVHCGMREFDSETGETIKEHLDGMSGWVADRILLFERPVIIGYGGTILIRRRAHFDAGGFDPNLIVGEDMDYCYRIASLFKVGFVREILVDYRMHEKNSRLNIVGMERSLSFFYARVFDTGDTKILALRRRALGNFHTVLSGSYFHACNYWQFIKHAVIALIYKPTNVTRFLFFPFRKLARLGTRR